MSVTKYTPKQCGRQSNLALDSAWPSDAQSSTEAAIKFYPYFALLRCRSVGSGGLLVEADHGFRACADLNFPLAIWTVHRQPFLGLAPVIAELNRVLIERL